MPTPAIYRFVQQPLVSIFKSQIAFMGVSRRKGNLPSYSQTESWHPKTFTYTKSAILTTTGPPSTANKVSIVVPVTDYDFELHNLILTYQNATTIPTFVCEIQLFDQVHQEVSNAPMLDQFLNGAPGSLYQNGALVPPLIYAAQTSIKLDLYSLLTTNQIPCTVTAHFVGIQRIPC